MVHADHLIDPKGKTVLSQYIGVVGKDGQPVELGRGCFGTVYKATRKNDTDGRAYAIKIMKQSWSALDDKEKRQINREINTLFKCKHQHIIGFVDWCVCSGPEAILFPGLRIDRNMQVMCMVTEIAEHGDLAQVIDDAKETGTRIDEARIWKWAMQMTAALGELHKRYIIHRDIKPANVFLDAHENVKLGDLGIARELEDEAGHAETMLGTPLYIAPEVLDGNYGRKCDIWSLGVALHQLMTLKPPFKGNSAMHLYINISRFAPCKIPSELGYSNDLVQLSQWMMQKNPVHRPAAIDIYSHLTNNLPERVRGPTKMPYVDEELAGKTFGQENLSDEGARMPLAIKHSLGAEPTPMAPMRERSLPDDDSSLSLEDTSATVIDRNRINAALTKKHESRDAEHHSHDSMSLSLGEMLEMRSLPDDELEQVKIAQDSEDVQTDVDSTQGGDVEFIFAKRFFASVQSLLHAHRTVMDASLVAEVNKGIKVGGITSVAELEAFLIESKARFPKAWGWKPADPLQQRELMLLLRDGQDVRAAENWLLLKLRQELLSWNWWVMERFFRMVSNGELSTAIDRALAVDLTRHMVKNKNINTILVLDRLLRQIAGRHPKALGWVPDGPAAAALLDFQSAGDVNDADPNKSEFWLKLLIRQELCAFDPINRSLFSVSI